MKKVITSNASQKVILKNIVKKINEAVSIFDREDTKKNRAVIKDDKVIMMAEKYSFFTGCEMEIIMDVIASYRKKYKNLVWSMDTAPVLKELNHEHYFVYVPQVNIYFC